MNEYDFLEQVNELKRQYDDLEKEQKPLRRQHDILQRNFMCLYGSIRLLNLLLQNSQSDICPQMANQIELLNMFAEDFYNRIMNIKIENQDDLYEPLTSNSIAELIREGVSEIILDVTPLATSSSSSEDD